VPSTDTTILVSVIIPVFNAEAFLDDCIKSVIRQTQKNIEIILINDGSEDNSLDICERYKSEDSRIRVITGPNEGVSAARNKGIKASVGEYITFVDADDYCHDDYIEVMVEGIRKYHADLAAAGMVKARNVTQSSNSGKAECFTALETLRRLGRFRPGAACKLYKRSVIIDHSLNLDEGILYSEDTLFLVSYLQHIDRSVYINKRIYFQRNNPDSLTSQDDIVKLLTKVEAGLRIESICRSLNADEYIANAIRIDDCARIAGAYSRDGNDQKRREYLNQAKQIYGRTDSAPPKIKLILFLKVYMNFIYMTWRGFKKRFKR
jgi:glycosyltransferase involved in cell wall biosynthesis